MATCIKTGAVVLIKEYGSWVVCDIYEVPTQSESGHQAITYLLRCTSMSSHDPCPRQITHEARIGQGYFHESPHKYDTFLVCGYLNLREVQG